MFAFLISSHRNLVIDCCKYPLILSRGPKVTDICAKCHGVNDVCVFLTKFKYVVFGLSICVHVYSMYTYICMCGPTY